MILLTVIVDPVYLEQPIARVSDIQGVDVVTTASPRHLSLNPVTGVLEYDSADSDCGSHVSGTTNGSCVSEIFPVRHL